MPDLSGVVLTLQHQYEVLGQRREGPIATVWRGALRGFDVPVDIVVLDSVSNLGMPAVASRAVAQRIAGVLKSATSVRSPYLLRVMDFGEFEDGTPFFVTDQSGTTTLADVIAAQGRLPLSGTVQVVQEVAKGLAAMHELGFGHMAVRAEHIAFEEHSGQSVTRLGGVGLGLLRHEVSVATGGPLPMGHLAPLTEADSAATRKWLSELRGQDDSGDWAAPEAMRPVPSPSPADYVPFDVYGLATLAYRCLTGRHPVLDVDDDEEGFDLAVTLRTLDEGALRLPSDLGVSLPDAVWKVLRGGLARDPGARTPGALDFARALAAAARPAEAPSELAAQDLVAKVVEDEAEPVPSGGAPSRWWPLVVTVLAVTNLATCLLLVTGGRAPVVETEPRDATWTSVGGDGNPEQNVPPQGRDGYTLTHEGSWRVISEGRHPIELVWDGNKLTVRLVSAQ